MTAPVTGDILALALKHAQQAEVYRVSRRETPVSFEANRLKMLETKESSGVALRLIKNGRVGFSATNDPEDVGGLVERAVEIAEFGAEAKFELPAAHSYADVKAYDERTDAVSIEEMVQTGQGMIDELRKENGELLVDAGVTRTLSSVEIANSRGAAASYKRTAYAMALHGQLIRGTDMLFVGDWAASSSPDLDPKAMTAKVVRQLRQAEQTVPAPTGDVPVVFSPRGVASSMVGPLTTALNGRTKVQGASALEGKIGAQVLDERFSMWDDPTVDLRPGSSMVDDEGLPTRKMMLIAAGVPQGFMYDLQTAGQDGAESTGSASRGLATLPAPSTSVLFIAPGDTPYDAIIAGVDDGLLVESLLGAGQGNTLGGDFGGNVLLGYRIQKGKVTGRVKDTMITGNVYTALNRIVAMDAAAEWVGGSFSTPAICCQGVTLSSKG